MNPLKHPKSNLCLGAPADWDTERDGPCSELYAVKLNENGLPVIHTFWKPTDAELLALNHGGAVNLRIVGNAHPAVWVGVIDKHATVVDQDKPIIAGV